MKYLFPLFAMLVIAKFSDAQTNTFPSSGNVGIGTTSPSEVLDVNGKIKSNNIIFISKNGSDEIGSGPFFQLGSATGTTYLHGLQLSTGGHLDFWSYDGSAFRQNMRIQNNGNVGISTTSPSGILSLGPTVTNKKLFIYDSGIEASGFGQSSSEFRIFGIASGTNHISLGKYDLAGDLFTEQIRIENLGNVGIGTTTPGGKLDVKGNIQTADLSSTALRLEQQYVDLGSSNLIGASTTYATNNGIESWKLGAIVGTVGTPGNIGGFPGGLAFLTKAADANASSLPIERMRIAPNGYVGIGTASPKEALSVNGNIRSKQVKVETANWPDYVFKPDYQLPSLADVKTYIDQNQHLPDMPSEKEIAQSGLNLGEVIKVQTKKMEELTLYLIEQKKENEKQAQESTKRANLQDAQIKMLEERLNALTAAKK